MKENTRKKGQKVQRQEKKDKQRIGQMEERKNRLKGEKNGKEKGDKRKDSTNCVVLFV